MTAKNDKIYSKCSHYNLSSTDCTVLPSKRSLLEIVREVVLRFTGQSKSRVVYICVCVCEGEREQETEVNSF